MCILDILPTEIRLKVFQHTLCLPQPKESFFLIAALRPCPKLYHEALSIFYGLNTVHVTEENVCSFKALSEATAKKIRNLSYHLRLKMPVNEPATECRESEAVKTFLLTCRRASNLRHLSIAFRCIDPNQERWDFLYCIHTPDSLIASRIVNPCLEEFKRESTKAQKYFNKLSALLIFKVMPVFSRSLGSLTLLSHFTGYVDYPDDLLDKLSPRLGPAKLKDVGTWGILEKQDLWFWDFTHGSWHESKYFRQDTTLGLIQDL